MNNSDPTPSNPLRGPWTITPSGLVKNCDSCTVAILPASVSPEVRRAIEKLPTALHMLEVNSEFLRETHAPELQAEHGGDDPASCSYCEALAETDALLRQAPKETPLEAAE